MSTEADGGDVSNLEFVEILQKGIGASPDAIGVVAENGHVVDLNASAERLFLSRREDVVGRSIEELGWWVDAGERDAFRDEATREGTALGRRRIRRRDGAVLDVYLAATAVVVGLRTFIFWIGRDVTGDPLSEAEASRLEQTLRTSIAERRRLVARLIDAIDDERAKVAEELRSGPIQLLTASQLSLARVRASFDATEAESLDRVESQTTEAIGELKRISSELHPAVLDREGLGAALRVLSRALEEAYGTAVDVDDRMGGRGVSRRSAVVAYRLVFDALHALRRRPGVRRLSVTVGHRDARLAVTIAADEESNAEPDRPSYEELGLASTRYLLQSIGGSLEVERTASRTMISATVPATSP